MRVITGTMRGRKLKEPIGMDIRPTTDMVKQAVFNIVQFDIEGRRVLDLFAGTGQMGIECLSRGADSCVFVDASKEGVALVRQNLSLCKAQAEVVGSDAISYLSRCRKHSFDLILLDPPYETDLLAAALDKIVAFDILSEGGIIVCESRPDKELPELESPYFLRKTYRYGQVKLTVYGREVD